MSYPRRGPYNWIGITPRLFMYSQDGFSIYTLQMVQQIGIFFQEIKFAFKVLVCCFLLNSFYFIVQRFEHFWILRFINNKILLLLLFSLSPQIQWSYVIALHTPLALVYPKPLKIFFLILHRCFLGYYAHKI